MKFKVKNQKVANHLGVKVGSVVNVLESQVDKWIKFDWGTEVIKKSKKEEKENFETKELKTDNETKDATNKD
jgi:hypothetical protein